jgi:hypothetical protein
MAPAINETITINPGSIANRNSRIFAVGVCGQDYTGIKNNPLPKDNALVGLTGSGLAALDDTAGTKVASFADGCDEEMASESESP